jgi:ABC-2 type transport system permease protein
VNTALRRLLEAHRFQGPPYPVARDLYRELQIATPDSLRYLLADLFERITFYDLRTTAATMTPLAGGRTRVALTIEAGKAYADGQGRETAARMNDLVEIGVLDSDGNPLYTGKHRLRTGTNRISVVVQGTPAEAGADPFGLLIDRNSRDNLRDVEQAAGGER